ncbi:MAG: Arsenical resistance operon repressor [uncultured Corynebacteriales bacterium]|uniref:Arsenical resistance operon repressor n=1 Tax=uncultured Mycobacteriales bacterium TaxID=581187 RepID=A0A6J4ISY1_9ACTN|nr:MAG: Arsenical resistance operon repressor [uncultured Corynebacteriales bacterium]
MGAAGVSSLEPSVVAPAAASCCPPITGAVLDHDEAVGLASVLKAVADPVRLRLLSLIQAGPDGEACVCDLIGPVGLSQPTVSHHLKVLHEAGLVTREKRGVWMYYRAVPARLAEIARALTGSRS